MSPQQAEAASEPEAPPKRDPGLCEVVFCAALSQILFARRALKIDAFQNLPVSELVSDSFDDIVTLKFPIPKFTRELLQYKDTTVFLRENRTNYDVTHLLGLLTNDIFPKLDRGSLVRFRVSFLRTKTWTEDCLIEYYNFEFKYETNGQYGIEVWRAGVGDTPIFQSDYSLWNLGEYLRHLPLLQGPYSCAIGHDISETFDDQSIGRWLVNAPEFRDSSERLQEREGYRYQRITRIEIGPLPETHDTITTSDHYTPTRRLSPPASPEVVPLTPQPQAVLPIPETETLPYTPKVVSKAKTHPPIPTSTPLPPISQLKTLPPASRPKPRPPVTKHKALPLPPVHKTATLPPGPGTEFNSSGQKTRAPPDLERGVPVAQNEQVFKPKSRSTTSRSQDATGSPHIATPAAAPVKANASRKRSKAMPDPSVAKDTPKTNTLGDSKSSSNDSGRNRYKTFAPKRKPKRPLQLFEDIESDLPETQEVIRETPITVQKAPSSKGAKISEKQKLLLRSPIQTQVQEPQTDNGRGNVSKKRKLAEETPVQGQNQKAHAGNKPVYLLEKQDISWESIVQSQAQVQTARTNNKGKPNKNTQTAPQQPELERPRSVSPTFSLINFDPDEDDTNEQDHTNVNTSSVSGSVPPIFAQLPSSKPTLSGGRDSVYLDSDAPLADKSSPKVSMDDTGTAQNTTALAASQKESLFGILPSSEWTSSVGDALARLSGGRSSEPEPDGGLEATASPSESRSLKRKVTLFGDLWSDDGE